MILETERILLRPFETSDFEAVHEYGSDVENVYYMIFGPNDEKATKEFIDKAIEKSKQDPRLSYDFAVVLKETNELIGGCGIYLNDDQNCADIGWILNKKQWKKGIMTEVASELLRFGFQDLHLHKITAQCNSENYGSYRVMERNNMRREGHFIDYKFGRVGSENKWYSVYFYGILYDEWLKNHNQI